jgi:glycosyltransferase involved in cell wall biosynthesis
VTKVPRLSIGLPVYNGADHLPESLEALLGQTFEDFELIISDNASTDDTADICHQYQEQDTRIRYFRQPVNKGSAANHNFVVEQARGEFFKWASHDDLYGRDLIRLCVEALDERPEVVLAHSWTAVIDASGAVTMALEYPLATSSPHAPERFRSLLFGSGGDDMYGVLRLQPLRPVLRHGSYYQAFRPMVTTMSLYGPFYQVPDWLYFSREHPERPSPRSQAPEAGQIWPDREWPPTGREQCTKLDPRRANRLLHPLARLYAEYLWGFVAGVRRSPLSPADRHKCYRYLAEFVRARAFPRKAYRPEEVVAPAKSPIPIDALVAGRRHGEGERDAARLSPAHRPPCEGNGATGPGRSTVTVEQEALPGA